MTKDNVEAASGEGALEFLFGEKGCHGLSEMESGSLADCYQSVVDLATSFYGDKPW